MHILIRLTLCLLLASSCVSTPTVSKNNSSIPVQQASYNVGQSSTPQSAPQKVQFSDQVEKTTLKTADSAEQEAINNLIKAIEKEEGFSVANKKDEHLMALFKTKVSGNNRYQILFAENTPFQLTLSAGAHFAILDADARDGQASIQLPRGVLNTYFQLQGKKQNSSQLAIEDGLYHVKDVLNKTHWGHWMQLGARLLPIPQDWHNDDGEGLVLQLQPTDLASFHMVWLAESETAPFPPGVNEIGPEGGVVELPGVGKMEIPEGALDDPVVISMKQVMAAYPPIVKSITSNGVTKFETPLMYTSSLVELQPHGLEFKKEIVIRLKSTVQGWNQHNSLMQGLSMQYLSEPVDIKDTEKFKRIYETQEFLSFSGDTNEQTPIDNMGYKLKHFSFMSRVSFNLINGLGLNSACLTSNEHNIPTGSTLPTNIDKVMMTRNCRVGDGQFIVYYDESDIFINGSNSFGDRAAYLNATFTALEKGFVHYTNVFQQSPEKFLSFPNSEFEDKKFIPVIVKYHPDLGTAAVNFLRNNFPIMFTPLEADTPRHLETIYHELLHCFQGLSSGLSVTESLSSDMTTEFKLIPHESSARFIGGLRLFRDFNFYRQLKNFTSQNNLVWGKTRVNYEDDLQDSLKSINNSIYYTEDRYDQVGLMSFLWHEAGGVDEDPKKDVLAERFFADYNNNYWKTNGAVIESLNDTLSFPIQNNNIVRSMFVNYSVSAYKADKFGMGSAGRKEELSLTVPVVSGEGTLLRGTHSSYKRAMIINSHDQPSLSTRYYRVTLSQNLSAPIKIILALESQQGHNYRPCCTKWKHLILRRFSP